MIAFKEIRTARPPMMFGLAVFVLGEDTVTGQKYIWYPATEGGPGDQWVILNDNVDVVPSFRMDDIMLAAWRDVLNDERPAPVPDPAIQDVLRDGLDDAREVRDRLLSIIEEES